MRVHAGPLRALPRWAGNVKRVTSAVGEGAISIHMVHRTLAEL